MFFLYWVLVWIGFSYWLIFILLLFSYGFQFSKDLLVWGKGKGVKMLYEGMKRSKARRRALEARKKSFKKWEKDEGNNFPPHLEIFDKDRK